MTAPRLLVLSLLAVLIALPLHAAVITVPAGGIGEINAALLKALEDLLAFPQHQNSSDPKLFAALHRAQKLVHRLRGPAL